MNANLDVAQRPVGHPKLRPTAGTAWADLVQFALARSVVAEALGGWMVQRHGLFVTDADPTRSIAAFAALDDPTPDRLRDVAELLGGAGERHSRLWSVLPATSTGRWTVGRRRALTSWQPGESEPSRDDRHVRRVDDRRGLAALGRLLGDGSGEELDVALLADPRIQPWRYDDGTEHGAALIVTVDEDAVLVASAGSPRITRMLALASCRDRRHRRCLALVDDRVAADGWTVHELTTRPG